MQGPKDMPTRVHRNLDSLKSTSRVKAALSPMTVDPVVSFIMFITKCANAPSARVPTLKYIVGYAMEGEYY